MVFNPDIHHRRSIRYRNHDYSRRGAYFVTLCKYNRECAFGEIHEGSMRFSSVGEMVFDAWHDLSRRFPTVELVAFVVMPNHIHGIIFLADSNCQGAASSAPTLGKIVRAFKSITGIAGNRLLDRSGQPFWQRNYWERVIRDDDELESIREYIHNNPARWEQDTLNTATNP